MKIFLSVIALCCVVISLAQASTSSKMKLTGYVTAFNDATVTIESGNQRYTIPRTMYADKAKSGEMISVPVTETEFAALKHQTVTARQ